MSSSWGALPSRGVRRRPSWQWSPNGTPSPIKGGASILQPAGVRQYVRPQTAGQREAASGRAHARQTIMGEMSFDDTRAAGRAARHPLMGGRGAPGSSHNNSNNNNKSQSSSSSSSLSVSRTRPQAELGTDLELMPSSPIRLRRPVPLQQRVTFTRCTNAWCRERVPSRLLAEHEAVCREWNEAEAAERRRTAAVRRRTQVALARRASTARHDEEDAELIEALLRTQEHEMVARWQVEEEAVAAAAAAKAKAAGRKGQRGTGAAGGCEKSSASDDDDDDGSDDDDGGDDGSDDDDDDDDGDGGSGGGSESSGARAAAGGAAGLGDQEPRPGGRLKHGGRVWLRHGHPKPWRSWRLKPARCSLERHKALDRAKADPAPRDGAPHVDHSACAGHDVTPGGAGARLFTLKRSLLRQRMRHADRIEPFARSRARGETVHACPGCGEAVPSHKAPAHLAKECAGRPLRCDNTPSCGHTVRAADMPAHRAACVLRKKIAEMAEAEAGRRERNRTCAPCGSFRFPSERDAIYHATYDCPFRLVECLDPGCGKRVPEHLLPEHRRTDCRPARKRALLAGTWMAGWSRKQ